MSKKDTTYSDAMNEWAAKQSFLRNRKNRLIHPNPELPAPIQALGYLFRVAVLVFVLSLIISQLSKHYYNGAAFNKELKSELQSFVKADDFDASNISWQGSKAGCKKISATGAEEAFYRNFEAIKLSFKVPLFDRIRGDWDLDELLIDGLTMELKSGGKTHSRVGATDLDPTLELMTAGIFPSPKLASAQIEKVSCAHADLSWGLSRATLGAIEGAQLEFYGGTPNWRMDLSGGTLRQNWLEGIAIDSLTVRRDDDQLTLSNGAVRLKAVAHPGTLEGTVGLDRLPKLDLRLNFPEAHTRDMIPRSVNIPEFFYGVLNLSVEISGSINTLAGVETSGGGRFQSGTFSKVPVFEAIDKMLKTSRFRIFSIESGEIKFNTSGGKLNVAEFSCKSKGGSTALRGDFVFTPAITSRNAAAANEGAIGNVLLRSRRDEISGMLHLGVRPNLIEGNELAASYFTESADGYVWMEIPLEGPISNATKLQQGKILASLRGEG